MCGLFLMVPFLDKFIRVKYASDYMCGAAAGVSFAESDASLSGESEKELSENN